MGTLGVNIERLLVEIKAIHEIQFRDKVLLREVIKYKANSYGVSVFYYGGSNAFNTLGGDVNLFLNDSKTNDELLVDLIIILQKLLLARKE